MKPIFEIIEIEGKSKDTLSLSELKEPLIDVVMRPGQILYVPAGFPHTTGTYAGIFFYES